MLELSSSIYTCDEGDSVISIIIIKTGVTLFDIDVIINLTDGTALGKGGYMFTLTLLCSHSVTQCMVI